MLEEEKNTLKKFLDPTYHLLERFREVAPGSYKHCQNVANLCESIALELGLDVDLLKIAAMYHDIGKIVAANYFSENQDDKNPHDGLDPIISYQIISRHVGDSVLILLGAEDMPREVLTIVSQHHGNTVLKPFYKKAKSAVEDHFRYKCSSPNSTEAAILMIVDSVEATARSLFNNNKPMSEKERKDVILTTIDRFIDDNQLDNLKIGILKIVKRNLAKELKSIYHKRVLYEDEEKE